jgi:hypothetical protein
LAQKIPDLQSGDASLRFCNVIFKGEVCGAHGLAFIF